MSVEVVFGLAAVAAVVLWLVYMDYTLQSTAKRVLGLKYSDHVVVVPSSEVDWSLRDPVYAPGNDELAMMLEYTQITWSLNISVQVDKTQRTVHIVHDPASGVVYVLWYRQGDSVTVSIMTPILLHARIVSLLAKSHVPITRTSHCLRPFVRADGDILNIYHVDGSTQYMCKKYGKLRHAPVVCTDGSTYTVSYVLPDEPDSVRRFQFVTKSDAFAARVVSEFWRGVTIGNS